MWPPRRPYKARRGLLAIRILLIKRNDVCCSAASLSLVPAALFTFNFHLNDYNILYVHTCTPHVCVEGVLLFSGITQIGVRDRCDAMACSSFYFFCVLYFARHERTQYVCVDWRRRQPSACDIISNSERESPLCTLCSCDTK